MPNELLGYVATMFGGLFAGMTIWALFERLPAVIEFLNQVPQ